MKCNSSLKKIKNRRKQRKLNKLEEMHTDREILAKNMKIWTIKGELVSETQIMAEKNS